MHENCFRTSKQNTETFLEKNNFDRNYAISGF